MYLIAMMQYSKALIIGVLFALVGCGGGGSDAPSVDSGSYTGTISDVNAEEQEIYVEVPDAGTLELYFTDSTEVVKNFMSMPFDSLKTDQEVRVEVEKVGKRLDPKTVHLLN